MWMVSGVSTMATFRPHEGKLLRTGYLTLTGAMHLAILCIHSILMNAENRYGLL